jgi:hypothetical protein
MSWNALARELATVKARTVLFVDACHSGSIGIESATNEGAVADIIQGLFGRPIVIFAAAKARQQSFESKDIKAGYFSYCLTQILGSERTRFDLNGNGILEISELYMALKGEVSRRVWNDIRRRQTPWLIRWDMLGDFELF